MSESMEVEVGMDWGIVMYKMMFFLAVCLLCSGCNLVEGAASDVGGWDVSACVSGMDVCWELFTDNSNKFEGGFADAMGGLSGGTK